MTASNVEQVKNARKREWLRAHRSAKKANGICVQCSSAAEPGHTLCLRHLRPRPLRRPGGNRDVSRIDMIRSACRRMEERARWDANRFGHGISLDAADFLLASTEVRRSRFPQVVSVGEWSSDYHFGPRTPRSVERAVRFVGDRRVSDPLLGVTRVVSFEVMPFAEKQRAPQQPYLARRQEVCP